VTARTDLLLLDTNIIIHLIRDDDVARRVDAAFQIRHRADSPLISIVTVGECLSFAQRRKWGSAKVETLEALLRELVVVSIDSKNVLDRYAEFHSWTRSIGRTLGDNDLWIAATASAAAAHLITTDGDFDPLHPDRIRRTLIAERS
jgi:tRNA(fMet)-specific endonuclease VapC